MSKKTPHVSILADEMIQFFEGTHINVFFDGTLGAGGHAKRVLEAHPEITTYIGCDQDPEALQIAAEVLKPWKDKVEFVHGNFADLDQHLSRLKIKSVDGFFLI